MQRNILSETQKTGNHDDYRSKRSMCYFPIKL